MLTVVSILAISVAALLWQLVLLRIHVAFAADQVRNFQDAVTRSLRDPQSADENLEYVKFYYPSGTKQRTGTTLDSLVESVRKQCLKEIEQSLRDRPDAQGLAP
ncbi:MAG: hypothetical protein K1X74_04285 [Pirellulales bacterium]|nr:hypothetical protein [Pirellulales bacterium]